jgi:hypothetical protein
MIDFAAKLAILAPKSSTGLARFLRGFATEPVAKPLEPLAKPGKMDN